MEKNELYKQDINMNMEQDGEPEENDFNGEWGDDSDWEDIDLANNEELDDDDWGDDSGYYEEEDDIDFFDEEE